MDAVMDYEDDGLLQLPSVDDLEVAAAAAAAALEVLAPATSSSEDSDDDDSSDDDSSDEVRATSTCKLHACTVCLHATHAQLRPGHTASTQIAKLLCKLNTLHRAWPR